MKVFWLLLAAHVIADFVQPNWLLRLRKDSKWGYELHSAVTMVLTAIVLYQFTSRWIIWSILLGATHLIIDRAKHAYQEHYGTGLFIFIIDQSCHVFVVLFAMKLGNFWSDKAFLGLDDRISLMILGFLSVSFAVSILIFEMNRVVFRKNQQMHSIVSWPARFVGMTERSVALAVLLAFNNFLLLPVAFIISLIIKSKDLKEISVWFEKGVGAVSVVVVYIFISVYS